MRIAENKQIVLDFYDAGARGDMDACLAFLAADITWTNIGTTRLSGTYSGKQAVVEQLLGPFFSQLKSGIRTDVERLTAEDDIVVAQATGSAETLDGTPYRNTYCHVFCIRDGKITDVKEYFDTAYINAVFGGDRYAASQEQ